MQHFKKFCFVCYLALIATVFNTIIMPFPTSLPNFLSCFMVAKLSMYVLKTVFY